MKFIYVISALAATVMAVPAEQLFEREAALTCNYRCSAPVRQRGAACACGSQVAPCFVYNCQGGTQAIGGNNAEIFHLL